jgi:chemotaxis protein MotB
MKIIVLHDQTQQLELGRNTALTYIRHPLIKTSNMKSKLSTGLLLVLAVVFSSCGTGKKLEAAQAENQKLTSDLSTCNSNLTAQTNTSNAKIADLNSQLTTCSNQNAALAHDAAAYRELKADLKARQEALNAALAEQGTSLREIREKIITGLSALADSGISVEFKNGLLYVSLPENLLFPPGSATLSKNAKNALSPLASVLNNYPKVQIYVVGHTDSLKIHTGHFQDNWSLSTERGNSIVRVLRDNYSVDPTRLLAGGRSKYAPVATNDTKEGRALNRRIQIILNPDLTKLWDMMNQ